MSQSDARPVPGVWVNPDRQGGVPCFDGTRIPIATLFDHLPEPGIDELLRQFPSLARQDAESVLNRAPELLTETQSLDGGRSVDRWREQITIDAGVRAGQAAVRGLRITVADIIRLFAAGMAANDILVEYPYLTLADLDAACAYAGDALTEHLSATVSRRSGHGG